jgi:hypothetical protein
MARTGLTKFEVKETRDRLLAEGKYPSVDAVRQALGNTGSKSTIHRFLKELEDTGGDAGARRDDTARALQQLVDQLADKLHADAELRLRLLRAEHEVALRLKDEQLVALHEQVAQLTARIEDLEHFAPPPARERTPGRDTTGRADLGESGFRAFGDMLANPRGGRRDASPFSIMLTSGRTEAFSADKLLPAGLKLQ